MTGCQGLVCVSFPGQHLVEELPMMERATFEVEHLRLFEEPSWIEEAYPLEQWLDLNA
jgi:hypothetical protein